MIADHVHDHAHDEAEKAPSSKHDGHSHGIVANADRRYLVVALALIVGFMIVEVIVAVVSGSLALLSDAGHMLTDAGAIAASLWALNLAARPARGLWTCGFKRAEILSAAANGITCWSSAPSWPWKPSTDSSIHLLSRVDPCWSSPSWGSS
ncbi:MAG: hypothetical protein NVS3B6_13630 [Pseudarthrobacter sp.]